MKRAAVIGLLVGAVVLAACTSANRRTVPATSDTVRISASPTSASPTSASRISALPTSASPTSAPVRTSVPAPVFRPAHTVVVVMENHSYSDVIGNPDAPYINSLGTSGALFTQSFAVTHPSEPNYLALFSGSTQGVTDDSCRHTFSAPDLGTAMRAAGHSFAGYSESLPATGFTGCSSGSYARKHAPWIDFSGLPASVSVPFSAFPADYAVLPTLSFVIPNLDNDMHDGTVAQGDQWLHANLGEYVTWAQAHSSVLVLTWDEDDRSADNQILTIIVGSHVTAGRYSEHVTHYRLLRTLEYLYDLAPIGASANTPPVTDIWQP